jgi:hypothetical protein
MLHHFCFAANVGYLETVKIVQQGAGFETGFLVASQKVVCACSKASVLKAL